MRIPIPISALGIYGFYDPVSQRFVSRDECRYRAEHEEWLVRLCHVSGKQLSEITAEFGNSDNYALQTAYEAMARGEACKIAATPTTAGREGE